MMCSSLNSFNELRKRGRERETHPKLHPTENDNLDEKEKNAVHIAQFPGDRNKEVDSLVLLQIVEMLFQVSVAR